MRCTRSLCSLLAAKLTMSCSASWNDCLSHQFRRNRHVAWRNHHIVFDRLAARRKSTLPPCRQENHQSPADLNLQTTSYVTKSGQPETITAIQISYVTRPGPESTVTLPGSVYTSFVTPECSATPIGPITQCANALTSISTAYATRTIGGYNNTIVTTATDYEVSCPAHLMLWAGMNADRFSSSQQTRRKVGPTITSVQTTTVPG